MDELFVFSYTTEDHVDHEVEFLAPNWTEAKALAFSTIKGGEGLLSGIYLSDGIQCFEWDYGNCQWSQDCYA